MGSEAGLTAAFHFLSEIVHGRFGNFNSTAAGERCFGILQAGQEFGAPALAGFPERECLLHGILRTLKAAGGDGFADEGLLVGRQVEFHGPRLGNVRRAVNGLCRERRGCGGRHTWLDPVRGMRVERLKQSLRQREIFAHEFTVSRPALRRKLGRVHSAECVAWDVTGEYYRGAMFRGVLLRRIMCPLGVLAICLWFPDAARCQPPEKVTVCQLKADPPEYNHKLVEVTGFVTQGFEDFGLDDPTCPTWPYVWLEIGGTVRAGTMYCCGVGPEQTRPKTLRVEGIEIPLVEDDKFREFNRLIHIPPDSMVHATILGTFFAGRKDRLTHPNTWGGYGHLACCSLLAIEQVLKVDSRDREDLDYRASPDGLSEREMMRCGEYQGLVDVQPYSESMKAQRTAEENGSEWAFSNPRRVTMEFLSKTAGVEVSALNGIREERKAPGRVVYKWRQKQKKTTYVVEVSRPFWVSFYAKDPARIAWIVIAAYKIPCMV